jgi:eukaryotic-like serine/threonine-protein kinase
MGEVYRALDTRLDRTVAIKILSSKLSLSPILRARFEREAKAISALQHANICVLHDVGKAGDIDFLVMEYLEGETLAERLARKALTVDEALRIAIEIADALDNAHSNGVNHRDLKPGNIMLTKHGTKLMDFGLARVSEPDVSGAPGVLPETVTSPISPITMAGSIVGTWQYVSPEQIQGREADFRSDIFAFGATLYEMLTGKPAFTGKSHFSVATAILETEPQPLHKLQPLTPPSLQRLVTKCLAKDPEERWQSARDVACELRWIAEAGATKVDPADTGVSVKGQRRELLYAALGVLSLCVGAALWHWRRAPDPARPILAEISLPANLTLNFTGTDREALALSPDGRALLFQAEDETGSSMLWIRPINSSSVHPVPSTERATDAFWSPDSRAIGFFANGKLKTVPVSGGPPRVLAAAPVSAGGSWGRDGTILFVPESSKGIYRVPAEGGETALVVPVGNSKFDYYSSPRFLPDGKHFIYLAGNPAEWAQPDGAGGGGEYFASLQGGQGHLLVKGLVGDAAYASGFLLFAGNRFTLMAQPFEPERGELKGEPKPLSQSVALPEFAAAFSASQNGILIFKPGGVNVEKRLTWFDRTGKSLGTVGEIADYYDLRLSPDGRKLACNAGYPAGSMTSEIYVDDLAHGSRMRLTIDPDTDHGMPMWSPDGREVLFAALQSKEPLGLYQKAANGARAEELLLPAPKFKQVYPTSISKDGRFILFTSGVLLARSEIWLLDLHGDRKPRVFVSTKAAAYDGQFSPDNKWVAYTSRESGQDQVYVIAFDAEKALDPAAKSSSKGGQWQVSVGGGRSPRWRRDGRELFFLSSAGQMLAAQMDENDSGIQIGTPRVLFRSPVFTNAYAPYDVTPDGQKFIMNLTGEHDSPLTLIVNWMEELK